MKTEISKEFENSMKFFDAIPKLAKDCAFCDFWLKSNEGERRDYKVLSLHCYTSHPYEMQELSPKTVIEFL